jgi:hypothetical protein
MAAISGSGTMVPDWTDGRQYEDLLFADRRAFAWEWLRRSSAYRLSWTRRASCDPQTFGLERFEDPAIGIPDARPLWSILIDPAVVRARPDNFHAEGSERVSLHELRALVSLSVDASGNEHVLLSDGRQQLRLDLLDGTLIGCPASLRFDLEGFSRFGGQLPALQALARLVAEGAFGNRSRIDRHARWILELRTADALAAGASQQQIARIFFGSAVAARWRRADDSYRKRVQRLVAHARAHLREPLHARWFGFDPLMFPETGRSTTSRSSRV